MHDTKMLILFYETSLINEPAAAANLHVTIKCNQNKLNGSLLKEAVFVFLNNPCMMLIALQSLPDLRSKSNVLAYAFSNCITGGSRVCP